MESQSRKLESFVRGVPQEKVEPAGRHGRTETQKASEPEATSEPGGAASWDTVEAVVRNLQMIRWLLPQWPSDDELRATRRGDGVPGGRPVPPPSDVLPFNLDKTLDLPGIPKTRDGVLVELQKLVAAWLMVLDPDQPTLVDPLRYLVDNVGRARDKLEPVDWEWSARLVARLARTAEDTCGYGVMRTGKACPRCVTVTLIRRFTETGLENIFRCPACGSSYTPEQWTRATVLYVRYTRPDTMLTISEAAQLLGEDPKTIWARVKRRGYTPDRRGRYQIGQMTKKTL